VKNLSVMAHISEHNFLNRQNGSAIDEVDIVRNLHMLDCVAVSSKYR